MLARFRFKISDVGEISVFLPNLPNFAKLNFENSARWFCKPQTSFRMNTIARRYLDYVFFSEKDRTMHSLIYLLIDVSSGCALKMNMEMKMK